MSETIKTQEAKYQPELLDAIEATLKHHNLRLVPGQSLQAIADAFEANQVKVEVKHGYLAATQRGPAGTDMPVHLADAVEGLLRKEPARFFPREVDGVTHKKQLDFEGKLKFIRERNFDEWEKLPLDAPTERVVVLDRTKLTAKDWKALDVKTKSGLIKTWGRSANEFVMAIMARK